MHTPSPTPSPSIPLPTKATLLFASDHPQQLSTSVLLAPLLSFTIYPRTHSDIRTNEFLWHAVHNSTFSSHHLDSLPSSPQIFALHLPPPLAAFLAAVSLDEMHTSVLYMLADAAQGEDEQGLQAMHHDLAPDVWNALQTLMLSHAHPQYPGNNPVNIDSPSHCISYASFMLDEALQSAQAHNYWKIDVLTALFVDQHSTTLISPSPTPHISALHLRDLYYDWISFSTNCRLYQPARNERQTNKLLLHTMLRLVRDNAKSHMWQRIRTVLLCANRPGCLLATIPSQVITHLLVPYIVMDSNPNT